MNVENNLAFVFVVTVTVLGIVGFLMDMCQAFRKFKADILGKDIKELS